MNWTGGKLKRHKHGGNGLINKQKAFFAKQRTNLQSSGPSTSSPATPFSPGPAFVNSILRPSGIRPSQTHEKDRRAYKASRPAHSGSRTNGETRHRVMKRKVPPEYRRASLEPRSRTASIVHSVAAKPPDELEVCRQRLLQQNDWLGLASTRPLQMRLSPQESRHKFGKGRKMHRNESCLINDTTNRLLDPDQHGSKEVALMSGALGGMPDRVHVRIGEDALATQTQLSDQSRGNQSTFGRGLSPDSMLLDAEESELGSLVPMSPTIHDLEAESMLANTRKKAQIFLRSPPSHETPSQSSLDNQGSGSRNCRVSKCNPSTKPKNMAEKNELPKSRLTSNLDFRDVKGGHGGAESLVTGPRKIDNTWRAMLALPDEKSESVVSTRDTQSIQSGMGRGGKNQNTRNIGGDFEIPPQAPKGEKPAESPGYHDIHGSTRRTTRVQDDRIEQPNQSPGHSSYAPDRQSNWLRKSPPTLSTVRGDDELWRRFVFEDATEYDLHALVHQEPSLSVENQVPQASTWSMAALASKSSSLEPRATLGASGEIDAERNEGEAEWLVSSEDLLGAVGSTYNNVSDSRLSEI